MLLVREHLVRKLALETLLLEFEMARAVHDGGARRIYILITEVSKRYSFLFSQCFLKEIGQIFVVFWLRCRNTREHLKNWNKLWIVEHFVLPYFPFMSPRSEKVSIAKTYSANFTFDVPCWCCPQAFSVCLSLHPFYRWSNLRADGQSISHLPGSFLLLRHHRSGTGRAPAQTLPPGKEKHNVRLRLRCLTTNE